MTGCATWVVPCFNEADRLDAGGFLSLVDGKPDVTLLFVDDGSTDGTLGQLQRLAERRPDSIRVLSLPQNRGKAEAVRAGLVHVLDAGAAIVGYLDADLATPPTEAQRLLEVLHRSEIDMVIGSRVALLGRAIDRSELRHYLGRLFASVASLILRIRVYDTQCGAKLFRRNDALITALGEPFLSSWAFDVELIGRLLTGTNSITPLGRDRIVEEPLLIWRDVPGSKLRAKHMVLAAIDLTRIAWDLMGRRRSLGRPSP